MSTEDSSKLPAALPGPLKLFRDDITNLEDGDLFDDINALIMDLKTAQANSVTLEIPGSIDRIFNHLTEAKSTMTTLPKQFIYMSLHLDILKEMYTDMDDTFEWRKHLADILSVVSIVTSTPGAVLMYRFNGRGLSDLQIWGLEYVKRLIEDIRQEYYRLCDLLDDDVEEEHLFNDLYSVAYEVVNFCVNNNAEIELCDMAMEIEQPELIKKCLNEQNYKRVLLYVKTCTHFVCHEELEDLLQFLGECYIEYGEYVEALIVAIRQNKLAYIVKVLTALLNDERFPDTKSKELYIRQIAHVIYAHRVSLDTLIIYASEYMTDEIDSITSIADKIRELAPSSTISEYFKIVAKELDILEPKKPDEIFKEKTAFYYPLHSVQDNTRTVIATAVVSGFVNAGFSKDCMLQNSKHDWYAKLKETSCLTAVACIGLLHLWDIDEGLLEMDRYLYTNDVYVKSGAIVACALLSSGNPDAGDVTFAIISSALNTCNTKREKLACINSLGLAMAGTCDVVTLDLLDEIYEKHCEDFADIEYIAAYAISVGMIALGSKRPRELNNLFTYLYNMKDQLSIKDTQHSYVAIAYCLLYFGTQSFDDAIESFADFPTHLKSYITVMLNIMAYAGSGNVSIIQYLLNMCTEALQSNDDDKSNSTSNEANESNKETTTNNDEPQKQTTDAKNPSSTNSASKNKRQTKKVSIKHQALMAGVDPLELSINETIIIECTAAIGIAAVGLNDESGIPMCYRLYNNILQYGSKILRRIVPVSMALLSASNPQVLFIDTLSKLSHDNDAITSCNAILSLGIIGAGTNNAKIASLLRQLTVFFYKDSVNIFATRLALGILHTGKGMLSLSPIRDNKSLVSNVSLASLLLFSLSCVDTRNRILGTEHYLFFWMACAMKPRYLITIDEDNNHINIPVRVGQLVDTVGQAGDPRTITGFQTHKTPVLLGYNERAELATEEYISLTPILEGVVYVKKNPDYVS